ncbi:acyl-CoA dehydrogenase [Nitrosococcus wardiae]|uniref:Acyl-coenzyme A dehydrogenase n=1 Tax=Nitrosococcus wardiae TaxID=1814290 RepID=A0A4P7C1V7_9GAMM|nr:acyl-CoA dehydrogenase [Nitrosococcus wardiae]QBQ55620.1 acyl-CoA dehydrogenase [Nitrosococcus wardiae]
MATFLSSLRRNLISRPVLNRIRRVLPPLSKTEQQALHAGTVSWEAELFSGRPDWKYLHDLPPSQLTEEEQAFIDDPTEELCRLLDDWEINHERKDLPPEVWQFIKDNGFWGMIIPKAYGGLEFSALAHSSVIVKLASRSVTAAVTVMVPNSLGPSELLLLYGTEEQKSHYLPRLARGEELPCFAMTGPTAGSDAASMPDSGIICYGDYQGKRTLGMRVSWNKRYITLGPVATVLGLAFHLYDPEHLLGEKEDIGITLALVPTGTPGVQIGRRHYPSYQAFQNGPTTGQDVFMPLEWIIGGQERVGQGWQMLMECLGVGRSVSLPSLSTGAAKLCARTTGDYARVRKQFHLPIGKFEGVEEVLTRIAANAYLLDSLRTTTTAVVDQGNKPSILSAIAKYHSTTRMRESINDAMDVHGGKAICEGPNNYLANSYHAIPVSITVEGANILTRSMIIFGQGAIRCHPYLLKEMQAAQDPDEKQGLIAFDQALFGHMGFLLRNLGRAWWHNLTGGRWAHAPEGGVTVGYYRQLSRLSASFALVADLTSLILGGELKRREKLSGRLGDCLSHMYLLSGLLKRFEDDGQPQQDLPLLHWCSQRELYLIQQTFEDILANFPSRPVGWLLRGVLFPWGRRFRKPPDDLGRECASLLLSPSTTRDRLTAGIFLGSGREEDPMTRLEQAFEAVIAADEINGKLHQAAKEKGLKSLSLEEAVEGGVISEGEAKTVAKAKELTWEIITVDDFAPEELTGVGLEERKQAVSG